MNTGILYIIATPIGNLGDITNRAIETLQKVGLIVCEDTRTSKKLLDKYEIKTPTVSFYQFQRNKGAVKPVPKLDYIIAEIKAGKNVALITDAGTPGISDPGNQLVERAIENGIAVIPIPGVSALTTLASVSGIDLTKFVFLGFPPHKKGRETFFKKVVVFNFPVIYFESPHRLIKNLELLKSLAPEKKVILGRELTKMFEEIVRGNVSEVLEYFTENKDKVKGEIVTIAY
ncbi:MAG TPA: 16S rRNA (cytidine(1402)-2'-O)-methyltransferase [Candidatus Moranbacteria bacterium]|nr:16S rRNA (cytidine(1402)-2'-O)-methyltransferase [Candidatus Moranbacteria bacterium]HAT74881.1 16S rRNA (cytidine(1402)-2'-O)-methyltransferase [Candidatus Moranbacteria bacterium]